MTAMTGRTNKAGKRGLVRNEAGFTLVEALVALTITGIVSSALISLLVGQSRFYDRTDDQLNAEQVVQATFDLVSAEVRMASATDLLAASADSVSFRFDLLRGIVCDSTAADEAAVYVYDRTTNAGLTGSFAGTAVSGPYEETFEYADNWNPTPTATGSGPKATCTASGAPGTAPDSDYLRITGWTAALTGDVPERGALMRGYGSLTYRFAASTFFTTRTALWRGTQELVGPFDSGAAFSYVMSDATVRASVAGSSLDSVVAVRMTATATGEGSNPHNISRQVNFDVPFRN
ncbi:MAG: type II secretion system protein [Gemmatimonadales bacterium]|nr:MAG: type II secretion system protein [Gemmatimonadales bacterium]